MKIYLPWIGLLGLVLASCSPMTPADYQASVSEQKQEYSRFQQVYKRGQTPSQIRESIRKAGIKPMLADQTRYKPKEGWEPKSWELLQEQAYQTEVPRVDRFAFGGISGFAAVVYYHRVFYDSKDHSIGWYITHD
ncbi:MAG: hypothetical protein ABIS50_12755 [Luteolibacter sp.]|uniref:hypothetical protein n=1 Tax=Luteolibacter sp. TaxID=1962973 RepID=UPI003266BA61